MLRTFVLLFMLFPFLCSAADPSGGLNFSDLNFEVEEAQIPKIPSTPPLVERRVPVSMPHCERYFVFRGQSLECDSEVGTDALRLRRVMFDTPEAIVELDTYRENRKGMKLSTYIVTAGFLAVIAGFFFSRPPFEPGSGFPGTPRVGGYAILIGTPLILGGLAYGVAASYNNEKHIGRAVDLYNSAHPHQQIQLQFSTGFNF